MKMRKVKKQTLFLVIAIVLGVALMIGGSLLPAEETSTATQSEDIAKKEAEMAKELAAFLEKVNGISGVDVMVTLESSDQTVYAKDNDASGTHYVIVNAGGQNHLTQTHTTYAKVRGIAVVCVGGELAQNQEKIIDLLATLYDIPKSSVSVAGKK